MKTTYQQNCIDRFIQRWHNARAVIKQIRNDEWNFVYNQYTKSFCTARRKGRELWVANGAFFVDVDRNNVFGLLFRHYVWWAGCRYGMSKALETHKNVIDITE